jgi:hypothetical protein
MTIKYFKFIESVKTYYDNEYTYIATTYLCKSFNHSYKETYVKVYKNNIFISKFLFPYQFS